MISFDVFFNFQITGLISVLFSSLLLLVLFVLPYFILFCVASHGRGSSPSAGAFLSIRVSFCHFKYSQRAGGTPKMSYWTERSARQRKGYLYPFCEPL